MPAKEPYVFYDDKLLRTMCASVNDVHNLVHRSKELIEQSRIVLGELVVLGVDGRRISST